MTRIYNTELYRAQLEGARDTVLCEADEMR